MTPFDGGRIVAILSPKIWFLGVPILLGMFLLIPSPMFLIILLLLAPTIWRSLRAALSRPRCRPTIRATTKCRWKRACATAAYYVLLLAFLCVMTWRTHGRSRRCAPGCGMKGTQA